MSYTGLLCCYDDDINWLYGNNKLHHMVSIVTVVMTTTAMATAQLGWLTFGWSSYRHGDNTLAIQMNAKLGYMATARGR